MGDIRDISEARHRHRGLRAADRAAPAEEPEIVHRRMEQQLLRQTHELIEFVGPVEAVRICRNALRVALAARKQEERS